MTTAANNNSVDPIITEDKGTIGLIVIVSLIIVSLIIAPVSISPAVLWIPNFQPITLPHTGRLHLLSAVRAAQLDGYELWQSRLSKDNGGHVPDWEEQSACGGGWHAPGHVRRRGKHTDYRMCYQIRRGGCSGTGSKIYRSHGHERIMGVNREKCPGLRLLRGLVFLYWISCQAIGLRKWTSDGN